MEFDSVQRQRRGILRSTEEARSQQVKNLLNVGQVFYLPCTPPRKKRAPGGLSLNLSAKSVTKLPVELQKKAAVKSAA